MKRTKIYNCFLCHLVFIQASLQAAFVREAYTKRAQTYKRGTEKARNRGNDLHFTSLMHYQRAMKMSDAHTQYIKLLWLFVFFFYFFLLSCYANFCCCCCEQIAVHYHQHSAKWKETLYPNDDTLRMRHNGFKRCCANDKKNMIKTCSLHTMHTHQHIHIESEANKQQKHHRELETRLPAREQEKLWVEQKRRRRRMRSRKKVMRNLKLTPGHKMWKFDMEMM